MESAAKKISIVALGLIALVLIGVVGFFGAMQLHFHPSAPKPNYPAPASALDAQRQDIRYFRQLIAMDRSFTPAARAEANRRIDALEALDTVLDRPHFRVLLMQIDALADNGHSRIENEPSADPMELPVRVVTFSDGLYVMRATEQHACDDWTVCFWLNYFFEFRVESLDPDELVPLSFKDWRAGVDPVLDRAMTLTR
jgi:hypothetical protein